MIAGLFLCQLVRSVGGLALKSPTVLTTLELLHHFQITAD